MIGRNYPTVCAAPLVHEVGVFFMMFENYFLINPQSHCELVAKTGVYANMINAAARGPPE